MSTETKPQTNQAAGAQSNVPAKKNDIKSLMSNPTVKQKFEEIIGKGASAFISTVTTIATTTQLKDCDPNSILSCAIAAAALNLQVSPSLGFACLVPYKTKNEKGDYVMKAQFQVMSKGYIQLAIRSGQFKTINVTPIYEGVLKSHNVLTGEYDFTGTQTSEKVIGYAAYFSLLNGFEKTLYMTIAQIHAHGKKFSKTYDSPYGSWKTNTEAMESKTVIKALLTKFAPMSVDMQTATNQDQGILKANEETLDIEGVDFTDNPANVTNEPSGAASESSNKAAETISKITDASGKEIKTKPEAAKQGTMSM